MSECLECKISYTAKRRTSKFCSPKCRVNWNRKNKKAAHEVGSFLTEKDLKEIKAIIVDVFDKGIGVAKIDPAGIKRQVSIPDQPLSFDKIKQELAEEDLKPTYLSLLNGMAGILFADEKEEYEIKIRKATHLSDKQRDALLNHLKQMR